MFDFAIITRKDNKANRYATIAAQTAGLKNFRVSTVQIPAKRYIVCGPGTVMSEGMSFRQLRDARLGDPFAHDPPIFFTIDAAVYEPGHLITIVEDFIRAKELKETVPADAIPARSEAAYAFDCETNSLHHWRPDFKLLAFGVLNKHRELPQPGLAPLVVGANLKFDIAVWETVSRRRWETPVFDLCIAEYLLNEHGVDYRLEALASRYLSARPYKADKRSNMAAMTPLEIKEYLDTDLRITNSLYIPLVKRIREAGLVPIMKLLMAAIPTYARMEARGVCFDEGRWAKHMEIAQERVSEVEGKYPLNLNSSKQKADHLFGKLGASPSLWTDGGAPSTSADALRTVARTSPDIEACVSDWLQHAKYAAQLRTLKPLPGYAAADGRVHTHYNFFSTRTGRLSSSEPNLQNIDPELRDVFRATPGFRVVAADYSSLEMRLAADLAGEDKLLEIFRSDQDFHTAVTAQMLRRPYKELMDICADPEHPEHFEVKYRLRTAVKSINFGVLYGIGAEKMSLMLKVAGVSMPKAEVEGYITRWFREYPRIAEYIGKVKEEVSRTGVVRSVTGRYRRLPGASSLGPEGWRAQRQAVNFTVQSFASDLTVLASFLLEQKLYSLQPISESYMLTNVHDSISFETTISNLGLTKKLVSDIMVKLVPEEIFSRFGYRMKVPLAIDIVQEEG